MGGWFGLGAWVRQITPPPPPVGKHISDAVCRVPGPRWVAAALAVRVCHFPNAKSAYEPDPRALCQTERPHAPPPVPPARSADPTTYFVTGDGSFRNGVWTSSGGNFTWRQRIGSRTPTASTGPRMGPGGGSYVYLEASYPNYPSKAAYLTSGPAAYDGISFKYHMYGAAMGRLALEVKEAAGGWAEVWRREGQQHASGGASWAEATVVFPGQARQVRFVGVTGPGPQGDAAIADVSLHQAAGRVPLSPARCEGPCSGAGALRVLGAG